MARQLVRNREAFGTPWDEMPVFGTSAARFDDDGVTALYQHLGGLLPSAGCRRAPVRCPRRRPGLDRPTPLVPPQRARYLAEIAQAVRGYHRRTGRAGRARPPRASTSTRRLLQ